MTFTSATNLIREILFYISIISAFVSALLIIGIIWLLFKAKWLKDLLIYDIIEFLTFKPYGVGRAKRVWKKILERMEKGVESEVKLAVIEAEDLLDDILKKLGYKGESFGERIKEMPRNLMPNIDDLQEAHKIHNNIIHDPNYRLNLDQAKTILEIYKKALQNLEAF